MIRFGIKRDVNTYARKRMLRPGTKHLGKKNMEQEKYSFT
jgi:hypothetical protein